MTLHGPSWKGKKSDTDLAHGCFPFILVVNACVCRLGSRTGTSAVQAVHRRVSSLRGRVAEAEATARRGNKRRKPLTRKTRSLELAAQERGVSAGRAGTSGALVVCAHVLGGFLPSLWPGDYVPKGDPSSSHAQHFFMFLCPLRHRLPLRGIGLRVPSAFGMGGWRWTWC